jgi:ATP-binding cassette, subfamily B, bacterial
MFKRKRFPISYQLDAQDCGPACLEMIARHHGRTYSKQFIKESAQQDRQGTSMASIARAAEQIGFRTLAVRISFEDLREKAPLPCIAFWSHGHFVVVYQVEGDRVYIADPAAGLVSYTKAEFEHCWLTDTGERDWGIILLLEPTKQFFSRPDEPKPAFSAAADLWLPLWRDARPHLAPIGVGVGVLLFTQLVLPFLSAALIDVGIANRNLKIVYVILGAQMVLLFSRLSINLLQTWILTYIGLRIDMRLVAQFLMKLTRLPLSFFDGKLIGDLMQRISDHKALQQLLTDSLWQLLMALLSLAVFGTVLALFKPAFFAIFAIGGSLYLGYIAMFARRQRVLNHKNFRLSSHKQGMVIEFLEGMQEIKLNNAEQQRRWQWEAAQHDISKIHVKGQLLSQFQNIGGMTINETTNLILTLLVAKAVISGSMSLGTMVAVQYIIGQLTWPLNQLALLLSQSHIAALSYQRAKEIHLIQDEDGATDRLRPAERADIEFNNVSFSYGGTARKHLFKDLSLTIPYGKTTAIVGRSGSGKTTLLKLILKFYPVGSGQITLGGVNLSDVSHRRWWDLCGIVMQDGYIFSDTIVRNIALGEDDVDFERLAEVTRIAQIDSFIASLPLSYYTRIGRDGVGISRGQAQRILIARALYKDPQYVFFDEATSALDAETESLIVNRLRDILRGKTAVVIAHRMSTVRHADQVVLVDGGEVIEVGTHDELVRHRGSYFDLVRNQLGLAE